jgi:isopenicillin N synthase-like dioxygenase
LIVISCFFSYLVNSVLPLDLFESSVRYGAHTDYQGFTILKPDRHDWHQEIDQGNHLQIKYGGLEVFQEDEQKWIQVKIPKHVNALVINAGDLFQRWTNDRWRSALHRVIHLKLESSGKPEQGEEVKKKMISEEERRAVLSSYNLSRYSIVFFTGPLEECVIECIENINGSGEKKKYPPIKGGEHLLMKLNRTNASQITKEEETKGK